LSSTAWWRCSPTATARFLHTSAWSQPVPRPCARCGRGSTALIRACAQSAARCSTNWPTRPRSPSSWACSPTVTAGSDRCPPCPGLRSVQEEREPAERGGCATSGAPAPAPRPQQVRARDGGRGSRTLGAHQRARAESPSHGRGGDPAASVRKKAGWYSPGGSIFKRTAPKQRRIRASRAEGSQLVVPYLTSASPERCSWTSSSASSKTTRAARRS